MPRERDECIMERLVKEGIRGSRLVGINRARKVQEALFLSDIANADGTKIDKTYADDWRFSFEGRLGRHRSTLEFGEECPTDQNWEAWQSALLEMTTSKYYGFPRSLGKWVARLPRIWRIFYDEEENCIEAMSDSEGLVRF